jgi:cell division protein FtsL
MMNQRALIGMVWMGAFAVAAFGVYLVKYAVQDMQKQVASLEAQLHEEKESLHLLNAEWAYLNRPERLRTISEKHLELAPFDTRRMMPIEALPAMVQEEKNSPSVSERPQLFQPVGGY